MRASVKTRFPQYRFEIALPRSRAERPSNQQTDLDPGAGRRPEYQFLRSDNRKQIQKAKRALHRMAFARPSP